MNIQTVQFLGMLPPHKAMLAQKQIEDKSKTCTMAYSIMFLGFFVWICGGQHFYLGKVDKGVVWLITLGLLGFGNVYDLFTLPSQVAEYNKHVEEEVCAAFVDDLIV